MDNLIARLRLASVGLCSEDGRKYIPRGIPAADCVEVADHIQSIEEENKRLRGALEAIRELGGEINPSNYTHDDACFLNEQFCRAWVLADSALPLSHTIVGEGSGHD